MLKRRFLRNRFFYFAPQTQNMFKKITATNFNSEPISNFQAIFRSQTNSYD